MKLVQCFAFVPKTPPKRLRLWDVGENATDYGNHIWDTSSIELVFGEYIRRGNRLLLDVEHAGTVDKEGKPLPTAGYANLELVDGAPELVFDWSAYAVEQITTGQRSYLSPEYFVDDAGKIVGLKRVSLVGDPGTHHARVLAFRRKTDMDEIGMGTLLAVLEGLCASDDPAVVKSTLTDIVAKLRGASSTEAAPESVADVAAAADEPAGEKKGEPAEEKKDEPYKAAAPAEASPIAASALDALKKDIDAFKRDQLVRDLGDRISEPLRVWASSMPFEVVKAFAKALPATSAPAVKAGATRPTLGEGQGGTATLTIGGPAPVNELSEAMGIRTKASSAPYKDDLGRLVVPTATPTEIRARIAAAKKEA